MHPGFNFLALLIVRAIPWLIAALAMAGLLLMIVLYLRQKRLFSGPESKKPTSKLENLDLLYTLVDSMPDWIYIKDHESRFILANKHMASYHGINDPGEMIGKSDEDYYPPELAKAFYADEQEIMRSGKSLINHEENLIYPTGEQLVLSTTKIPVFDKKGKTVGIVGIGRNITTQKEDQQRLRELSTVASGTENVVVIMDREGNFKWVNKGFETRYGSTLEEFIALKGGNLRQLSSKEEINEILDEILKTGKPYTYSSRSLDADSKDAWYQTNITPIVNDKGEISSIFLIDADITVLKKADLQIKQQKYELESQRDQLKNLNTSKDRLFSIIAHDLKNPFQSIIGFSELLREDFSALNTKQVEEYLECIHTSSTTAYELLYNLLEWARSQTKSIKIQPIPIEVRELGSEILSLFSGQAKNKEILLRNKVNKELLVVADLNMLKTILRNLVANALKYTSTGGSISISGSVDGDMVNISVSDTGVGMEEEKVKTLFSVEKGESTPGTSGELGTGLGLLVSYEFLQLNKGVFKVDSKMGEGSTFTISLPQEIE
ncbi:MAG: PAS domain-containing protein [Bacteroides sp.]|nr:PAS domain-containing protein [Bacteroides sp.]